MIEKEPNHSLLYPLLLIGAVVTISTLFAKSPQTFKLPWFKTKSAGNVATPLPPKSPRKAKIPVLLYHYVEIVTNKDDFIRKSLSITPANFERHLLDLKNGGYEFYFVRDLDLVLNFQKSDKKPVIITFDDGYGDFYTDAFPILKKHGVKSTVFINSGLMGQPNYMTPSQVKEVAQSGLVEIGGHGYSHQDLTSISAESAITLLSDDIVTIKSSYGATPVSFSYPYGYNNESVAKLVNDAGYKYAVTLEKGWTVQDGRLLQIPRIRPSLAGSGNLADFLDSL